MGFKKLIIVNITYTAIYENGGKQKIELCFFLLFQAVVINIIENF